MKIVFINDFYLYNNLIYTVYSFFYKLLNILNMIFKVIIKMLTMVFYGVIYIIYSEFVEWYWDIRKTYQTFLYRFHAYHGLNLFKKKFNTFFQKYEYKKLLIYTNIMHHQYLTLLIVIISLKINFNWRLCCCSSWVFLTIYLYYSVKLRDLGPSYDIYDYNPDDDMGVYLTVGPFILFSWSLWTISANSTFIAIIKFFLTKYFYLQLTWIFWYTITAHSFINIQVLITINSFIFTNNFLMENYITLVQLSVYNGINGGVIDHLHIFNFDSKNIFFWFPWDSFFNCVTILSLFYMLTLLSIYNTENSYYLVLYLIFLVFLFAGNLVLMDLDIFAGLLLLIESVVILMLFFLVIYLSPNISFNNKINHWKVWILMSLLFLLLSLFSYVNLGEVYSQPFLNGADILDDFYEALNDSFISELTGIYVSLYWTNSLLLLVIGILLLIASIICVVLVSFFTKLRNYNYKTFLNFFDIAKNCYAFIFLRKQNLSKQGRGVTSTRLFNKKNQDNSMHFEYREKQGIFEKKKKNE